jgi:hypothetical protein
MLTLMRFESASPCSLELSVTYKAFTGHRISNRVPARADDMAFRVPW